MKRFQFSLETVLDYKQQVLDSLRVEHGALLAMVRRQEEALSAVEARYAETNEEFREKKRTGLTVSAAMTYEMGLRVLEGEIRRETEKLEALRRQEAAKRAEVVRGKQETSSLEILREKKLAGYEKEVRKQEELHIEEFVSTTRILAAQAAAI